MGYLILNNKIFVLFLFIGIIVQKTYSQQCAIRVTEFSPIYLKDLGKIQEVYSKLKLGDTSRIQLMYIRVSSQLNKKEAFYLGIDASQKIEMVEVDTDSIRFSKCISNTGKYNLEFLFRDSLATGYYVSSCKNVISSHQRGILMIYDASRNGWLEYTSMDGYMKESLNEDVKFWYLKGCYELITTVFKDYNRHSIQ